MGESRLLRFLYKKMPNSILLRFVDGMPYEKKRQVAEQHPNHEVRTAYLRSLGVKIGKNSYINQNFIIIVDTRGSENKLEIGERVSISPNVTVIISSSPNKSDLTKNKYVKSNLIKTAAVKIEDDAWIGANAVIFPGVTVGRRSIVGAGAVVRKDVKPDTIVAGVPAKKIRTL